MTLFTPSNLLYILGLSISSRILVIVLQFLSNILLADHNADAHRNKYHLSLDEDEHMVELLPNAYRYSYHFIEGFTKWDAQYFIEISKDGYTHSEQHLAFLPFFPMVISFTRQLLFGHTRLSFKHFLPLQTNESSIVGNQKVVTVTDLENYIQAALVGVSLNNFIFFPTACIFLFALTKLIKDNEEKYAKSVVWWFCFNPASIFFSSCYSESLFASLTFMAMFIMEYRSQEYISNHPSGQDNKLYRYKYEPLHHLNRLIYIILPALAPLALASATRSNGLVNIGFIIFHFLIKYAPLFMSQIGVWTILGYITMALELVQDILVLVMSSVLAASGFISFQIYSFIRICSPYAAPPQKGILFTNPLWCYDLVPHPYGQIQAKYWNVGLFKYYELHQLPNFLLAAPISFIVLAGSLRRSRELCTSPMSESSRRHQIAYYLQAVCLTLLCSLTINIQVITRLLISSCPAVSWICADLIKHEDRKTRTNKTKIWLLSYSMGYFVLGTVLHSNFYPWT